MRLSQKSGCGVNEHDRGRNDADVDRRRDLDKDVFGYDVASVVARQERTSIITRIAARGLQRRKRSMATLQQKRKLPLGR